MVDRISGPQVMIQPRELVDSQGVEFSLVETRWPNAPSMRRPHGAAAVEGYLFVSLNVKTLDGLPEIGAVRKMKRDFVRWGRLAFVHFPLTKTSKFRLEVSLKSWPALFMPRWKPPLPPECQDFGQEKYALIGLANDIYMSVIKAKIWLPKLDIS